MNPQEKHVVENPIGEIIAICLNKELADHFAKFLPYQTKVYPISYYEFSYKQIDEFMK